MKDLLFDTPYWILALLLVVGIALWWSGNNRQDKTLKRLGLGVALAGVALALLSFFVDTDKEMVVRRTRNLVHAVDQRDWKTFESILDAKTSFFRYHNRDELVAGAKKGADDIGLKSVRTLGTNVVQNDTVISVDLNVMSEQERTMGRPIVTSWRFDWENLGTGWRLQTIVALKSPQVSAEDIQRNLAR